MVVQSSSNQKDRLLERECQYEFGFGFFLEAALPLPDPFLPLPRPFPLPLLEEFLDLDDLDDCPRSLDRGLRLLKETLEDDRLWDWDLDLARALLLALAFGLPLDVLRPLPAFGLRSFRIEGCSFSK